MTILNTTPTGRIPEPSQMQPYHDLLREILDHGENQYNERTGALCKVLVGTQVKFDLRKGFPALTARKVPFKSTLGELLGFFRGATSAAEFRDLGCGFWDQNANETKAWLINPLRKGVEDLGPIYGAQWTDWKATKLVKVSSENQPKIDHFYDLGYKALGTFFSAHDIAQMLPSTVVLQKSINQLEEVVRKIMTDPTDRRILVTGWNVGELDEMALPPCHMTYMFTPIQENKTLHVTMSMRSTDGFLGAPANIMSTSIFLAVVARLTGYTAGTVTIQMANTHLYENSFAAAEELLTREELAPPRLKLSHFIEELKSVDEIPGCFEKIQPEDIWLEDYQSGDAIKVAMMA